MAENVTWSTVRAKWLADLDRLPALSHLDVDTGSLVSKDGRTIAIFPSGPDQRQHGRVICNAPDRVRQLIAIIDGLTKGREINFGHQTGAFSGTLSRGVTNPRGVGHTDPAFGSGEES